MEHEGGLDGNRRVVIVLLAVDAPPAAGDGLAVVSREQVESIRNDQCASVLGHRNDSAFADFVAEYQNEFPARAEDAPALQVDSAHRPQVVFVDVEVTDLPRVITVGKTVWPHVPPVQVVGLFAIPVAKQVEVGRAGDDGVQAGGGQRQAGGVPAGGEHRRDDEVPAADPETIAV